MMIPLYFDNGIVYFSPESKFQYLPSFSAVSFTEIFFLFENNSILFGKMMYGDLKKVYF